MIMVDDFFLLVFAVLVLLVGVLVLLVMMLLRKLFRASRSADSDDLIHEARAAEGENEPSSYDDIQIADPDIGWTGESVDEPEVYEAPQSRSFLLFGGNWMAMIGLVMLLIGVGFFIKLAIAEVYLTIQVRFIGSAVFALLMIGGGFLLRKKSSVYCQLLMSGGIVIFYLCCFIAGYFYQLISPAQMLVACGVIALLMLGLSYWQKSTSIAVIGQLLAFVIPYFLLFQQNMSGVIDIHLLSLKVYLPTYFVVMNAGMVVIAILARRSSLLAVGLLLNLFALPLMRDNAELLAANMLIYFVSPLLIRSAQCAVSKSVAVFVILVSALLTCFYHAYPQPHLIQAVFGLSVLMALVSWLIGRSRETLLAEVYASTALLSIYFMLPITSNIAIAFALLAFLSALLGSLRQLSYTRAMSYLYMLICLFVLATYFVRPLIYLNYGTAALLLNISLFTVIRFLKQPAEFDRISVVALASFTLLATARLITYQAPEHDLLYSSFTLVLICLIGVAYYYHATKAKTYSIAPGVAWSVLGFLFWYSSTVLIAKTACQYFGVVYRIDYSLFQFISVQAVITVYWAFLGLILTLVSSKKMLPGIWYLGVFLLLLSAAKLVFVDLSSLSGMIRVGSFIAIGIIFMLVGYFVPKPIGKSSDSDL